MQRNFGSDLCLGREGREGRDFGGLCLLVIEALIRLHFARLYARCFFVELAQRALLLLCPLHWPGFVG